MKYQKPDGVIELGSSGCCCPPGAKRPGQHTNSGTSWYRINTGEWKRVYSGDIARRLAITAPSVEAFKTLIQNETT